MWSSSTTTRPSSSSWTSLNPPLSSSSSSSSGSSSSLLPSEQRLAAAVEAQARAHQAPPTQLLPPLPIITSPPKKSRNDLFSLDWSNVTPHVASRSSTPPVVVAPRDSPSPSPQQAAPLRSPPSHWLRRIHNRRSSSDDANVSSRTSPTTSEKLSLATKVEEARGTRLHYPLTPPPLEPAQAPIPFHHQSGASSRVSAFAFAEQLSSPSQLPSRGAAASDFHEVAFRDLVGTETEFSDLQIGELQSFRTSVPDLASQSTPDNLPVTPPASISSSSISSDPSGPSDVIGPGISDNPVLDSRQAPRLRLAPVRDYSLGEGRHASVYLGSFIPREATAVDPPTWTLCAVKRIFPDRESQIAGLGEAFILSKLAPSAYSYAPQSIAARGSAHIVGLYGVRDERDGVDFVEDEGSASNAAARRRKAYEDASSGGSIGLGRAPSMHSTMSENHPRAASEATYLPLPSAKKPHKRSLRRQTSFTSPSLSPPIGSPEEERALDLFPMPIDPGSTEMLSKSKGSRHSEPPPPPPLPVSELEPAPTVIVDPAMPPTAEPRRRTATTGRILSDASDATDVTESTARTASGSFGRPPMPRIMLLLEYCPFGHVLGFAKAFPERMSRRRWLNWARDLASAVAWAHERGVLHADIKPQNVLVASDLSIRLADFGMAMFLPSATSTHPPPTDPLGLGTPPYAPPEFVRPPPSPFGRSADVFSLGVTLSVLITGVEPYANMRSVERMLWVGRGGYWEWEQRRRERGSSGTEPGSASVSRQGSIRSTRSGGRSRADSGTGLSILSSSGGGASIISPTRGSGAASLRRSESVESVRSVHSVASIGGRNRWNLAMLAKKLLSPTGERSLTNSPSVPSSPVTPSFTPTRSHQAHHAFLLPPRSPSSEEDDDVHNLSSSSGHGHSSSYASEDEDEPTMAYSAPAMYSDGTPHQCFLNGRDLVPLEVRTLLRSMTSPNPSQRPTAREVLSIVDPLE